MKDDFVLRRGGQYSFQIVMALVCLLVPLLGAICLFTLPGGAPQRAYVAGSSAGISVVSIPLQKVTDTIHFSTQPHMVLLSLMRVFSTRQSHSRIASPSSFPRRGRRFVVPTCRVNQRCSRSTRPSTRPPSSQQGTDRQA